MKTNKEYIIENYRGYGEVIVPKGTRLTHNTSLGRDPKYHFVDDLSFMKGTTGTNLIKHEATYYGIDVPIEYVDYEEPTEPPIPTSQEQSNTIVSESGLTLWVTGGGERAENLTNNDVLLRTDDATIHLDKGGEFGKLAAMMVYRYNSHDALANALKEAVDIIDRMDEQYRDATDKYSSYTQGEHKRLTAALNKHEKA